jgi:hypothetical protein
MTHIGLQRHKNKNVYWPQACAVGVGKCEWWGEKMANFFAITEGGEIYGTDLSFAFQ